MSRDPFNRAQDQYFALKGQLALGRITREQFDAALKELTVQDAQGRYWRLGPDSGKWYVHDGQHWIEADPHGAVPAPNAYVPAAPSFPQARTHGVPIVPVLAIGLVALVLLVVVVGLVVVSTQGILKISLPGASAPSPTVPRPLPLASPIVALPSPVPLPSHTATIAPTGAVPPTSTLAANVTVTPTVAAADLISKADALSLQSKFDQAAALYESAVQADASNPLALAHWAELLDWQAFLEKRDDLRSLAVGKAEAAAQLAPDDPKILVYLARAYIGDLNHEQALTAAQKAVQIAPASGKARAALAEAYLNKGNLAEAEVAAQQAFQLDANSAEVHRVLGYVLLSKGQNKAAVAEFEKAAQLEPNLAARHAELGARYQETIEYAKAAASYQLAIALYPQAASAYYGLGRAYFDLKQYDKAIESATRATQINKGYVEAYYFLGLLYYSSDDCARAIPVFQKNLELDSRAHRAMAYLGWCQYKAGNLTVASDWATRAAAIDPNFEETKKLRTVLVVALATPTPLPPPGLYVAALRMEPAAPARRQDVGFYVTFLNTAAGEHNLRWLVYIYQQSNLQKSYGETASIMTTFPPGALELKASGSWRTGIGGCEGYVVRVASVNSENKAIFFNRPNGELFEHRFTVCP